jgi:hypothetical protein
LTAPEASLTYGRSDKSSSNNNTNNYDDENNSDNNNDTNDSGSSNSSSGVSADLDTLLQYGPSLPSLLAHLTILADARAGTSNSRFSSMPELLAATRAVALDSHDVLREVWQYLSDAHNARLVMPRQSGDYNAPSTAVARVGGRGEASEGGREGDKGKSSGRGVEGATALTASSSSSSASVGFAATAEDAQTLYDETRAGRSIVPRLRELRAQGRVFASLAELSQAVIFAHRVHVAAHQCERRVLCLYLVKSHIVKDGTGYFRPTPLDFDQVLAAAGGSCTRALGHCQVMKASLPPPLFFLTLPFFLTFSLFAPVFLLSLFL